MFNGLNLIHRRDLGVALGVALFLSGLLALPELDWLRGLSIDVLTGLRWAARGLQHDLSQSPVVVVALDEETYNRKPFAGNPVITWTSEIGKVLTAVIGGGAKVVGF